MAYVFKHTPLESNFNINLTALVPGENGGLRPELLSLKACLQHFLDFREEVVERRLKFEKKTLLERIHILEGLVIIYDALDTALKIIRASSGRSDAADKLRKRFDLSEIQAFAVVDMHLHQLSRTNIEEIKDELKEKEARVKEIDAILKSPKRITQIVEKELSEIENKYGDNRRTKFSKGAEEVEFNEELYVVHEDVYAIVTTDGWIKRIRQNNELGSTRLREGDSIFKAHALSTLDSVAFITNFGNLYTLKAADFPSSSGYGDPIQKILKFKDGERIVDSFAVKGAEAPKKEATQEALPVQSAQSYLADGSKLLLVSKQGTGFVLIVEGLLGIKRSGKRAMKLREGDELAAASPLDKEAAMFTHQGSGLVIKTSEAPERDNAVVGIALMGVREDDRLVAAICFSGKAKFALKLDSGKTKEVESGEITAGHRGLKGTKVVSRDNIIAAARM
jgi:DNA gyrase subunit A